MTGPCHTHVCQQKEEKKKKEVNYSFTRSQCEVFCRHLCTASPWMLPPAASQSPTTPISEPLHTALRQEHIHLQSGHTHLGSQQPTNGPSHVCSSPPEIPHVLQHEDTALKAAIQECSLEASELLQRQKPPQGTSEEEIRRTHLHSAALRMTTKAFCISRLHSPCCPRQEERGGPFAGTPVTLLNVALGTSQPPPWNHRISQVERDPQGPPSPTASPGPQINPGC